MALRGCPAVLAPNEGLGFASDHGLGNIDVEDVVVAGDIVHDVQHEFFQQAAKGSSASAFL